MIKTRTDLAKLFAKLGFKTGAEIGVLAGAYGMVLCKTIPHLKYYGIDPWYVNDRMRNHVRKGKYELAKRNLAPYNATLISKTSMEGVKDFADSSLDFVYIDGNHQFDYVVNDIIAWIKKVKKGGIVSGHDYSDVGVCGVIPAVNGYVQAHSLRLNLTTDPTESISWWFVKRWNT